MHELSIALEICRVIEGQLEPFQLPQLTELGLEIGAASDIEVSNLEFCLQTLLAHPPFAGASLVVTRPPGDDTRVSYLELDDERTSADAAAAAPAVAATP
jgi:Zn finger protein HypA/HybF involved in hydrogenase expression